MMGDDDYVNPFRQERRRQRDARDAARKTVRDAVEPVPDVVCTQCPASEEMKYQRQHSAPRPEADTPMIEATWECPDCEGLAFGYVTEDGLTPILDNARPAENE